MNRREAIGRLLGGAATTLLVAGGLTSCRREAASSAPSASGLKPGMGSGSGGSLHIPCTACGDCMPCPYGVDIMGCFDVWNDAADNNDLPEPKLQASPRFKGYARTFLADYHNRIPLSGRADRCINCHKCEPLCPQHIPIPVFLRQMEWVEQNAKKHT